MSKTFDGLTPAQDRALANIAIGLPPRCGVDTLTVLLRRGLIVKRGDEVLGRDSFGEITVPVYEMPTWEHRRWCQWCADNTPDEDAQ